jgi:Ca-activated chloride channel family protein
MEVTETNVPITFHDSQSKNLKYSFIHTFNKKGTSDTLSLDPLVRYDIVVHTIPPVKQENIKIEAGRHTIIPIKTPQGSMIIKYTASKNSSPKNYSVIVRKSGEKDVINVQNLDKKEKYLVGKYDLEVLSLPRLMIDNVEIGQSSTTTIEIPESGTLRLDKGGMDMTGSIFVKDKQETKWVMNLDEDKSKETIDLMPNEYMIVIKNKTATKSSDTRIQEFKIESNQTTNVSLQTNK